jgi:hypothetical protein
MHRLSCYELRVHAQRLGDSMLVKALGPATASRNLPASSASSSYVGRAIVRTTSTAAAHRRQRQCRRRHSAVRGRSGVDEGRGGELRAAAEPGRHRGPGLPRTCMGQASRHLSLSHSPPHRLPYQPCWCKPARLHLKSRAVSSSETYQV